MDNNMRMFYGYIMGYLHDYLPTFVEEPFPIIEFTYKGKSLFFGQQFNMLSNTYSLHVRIKKYLGGKYVEFPPDDFEPNRFGAFADAYMKAIDSLVEDIEIKEG